MIKKTLVKNASHESSFANIDALMHQARSFKSAASLGVSDKHVVS